MNVHSYPQHHTAPVSLPTSNENTTCLSKRLSHIVLAILTILATTLIIGCCVTLIITKDLSFFPLSTLGGLFMSLALITFAHSANLKTSNN